MTHHPTITSEALSSASLPFDAPFDFIDSLTTSFAATVAPTLETTTVTEVALGYHRNQQYSITAMTTSTGAVAERYAYTAYGQPTILNASGTVLTSSAIGNRYTYTGREWDETLGLHHFRARWMSPLAGRFLGRDPIGYVDGKNVYQAYLVPRDVDPTGSCKVELVCANLLPWIEHCGIEITDGRGRRYYHVVSPGAGILSSDTCNVYDTGPGRINTPIGVGTWRVVDTWQDDSGTLCGCIDSVAALIRSKNLPYFPTPGNGVAGLPPNCSSRSTCNSNYTTHCIMSKCGIASSRNTGRSAPGWDHRMKKCSKISTVAGMVCSECSCDEWTNIDDEWCADPPVPPRLQPVANVIGKVAK